MAFTEIPTNPAYPPVVSMGGGYGYGGGYGCGFGGTALAAGAGAALGSILFNGGWGGGYGGGCRGGRDGYDGDGGHNNIIVDAFRGRGFGFDGCSPCCAPATCEQVNDVDRDVLVTGQSIEKGIWATDRDVLNGKYETEIQLCGLGKDVACGNYGLSAQIAENKYDTSLQLCNLQHEMDMCCCKTNENIMKMGYETQLRDACYKNDTDKQLCEIKCLVKDTAKDQTIAALQDKIYGMSQFAQTRNIQDCIKDTFCKTSSALNQIGLNEQTINPACHWPPFVPSVCCC